MLDKAVNKVMAAIALIVVPFLFFHPMFAMGRHTLRRTSTTYSDFPNLHLGCNLTSVFRFPGPIYSDLSSAVTLKGFGMLYMPPIQASRQGMPYFESLSNVINLPNSPAFLIEGRGGYIDLGYHHTFDGGEWVALPTRDRCIYYEITPALKNYIMREGNMQAWPETPPAPRIGTAYDFWYFLYTAIGFMVAVCVSVSAFASSKRKPAPQIYYERDDTYDDADARLFGPRAEFPDKPRSVEHEQFDDQQLQNILSNLRAALVIALCVAGFSAYLWWTPLSAAVLPSIKKELFSEITVIATDLPERPEFRSEYGEPLDLGYQFAIEGGTWVMTTRDRRTYELTPHFKSQVLKFLNRSNLPAPPEKTFPVYGNKLLMWMCGLMVLFIFWLAFRFGPETKGIESEAGSLLDTSSPD